MSTKPMNPYHEFLRLVYRTRRAQKAFFKDHSQRDQRAAMDLEKQVDAWLERAGFEAEQIRRDKRQLTFLEGNEK